MIAKEGKTEENGKGLQTLNCPTWHLSSFHSVCTIPLPLSCRLLVHSHSLSLAHIERNTNPRESVS